MNSVAGVENERPSFHKTNWLPRDIETDRRSDGSIVIRSRVPLAKYETCIPRYLAARARDTADRTWLAQRRGPERQWKKVTFAEGKRIVDCLTQGLLDLRLDQGRPLAILSGNSLEHAFMTLAAMQARIPVTPLSPAYSLLSQDHAKLRAIFGLVAPGAVFVQDGIAFERALAALELTGVPIICVDRPPGSLSSLSFGDLASVPPKTDVEQSLNQITGDTIAKFMLTSGSTGAPKAKPRYEDASSTISTTFFYGMSLRGKPPPSASQRPSSTPHAGHMAGAISSISPSLANRAISAEIERRARLTW